MPPLYLETNFLLSFAYGQHDDSEPLLALIEDKNIDVVIPEVCVAEAMSAWRNKRSRLLDVAARYGDQQRELGRWQAITDAADASDMSRDLPVKLQAANAAALDRLFDCLRRLAPRTRFIAGDRAWLDPETRIKRTNGNVDDYICSAIIADAQASAADAYFLTENDDFHEPSIVEDLAAVNVTVLTSPSDALSRYI